MNIHVESNFPFSVTSIQYAPDVELCITLSSGYMPPESRYQYTASLGDGHAEEKKCRRSCADSQCLMAMIAGSSKKNVSALVYFSYLCTLKNGHPSPQHLLLIP